MSPALLNTGAAEWGGRGGGEFSAPISSASRTWAGERTLGGPPPRVLMSEAVPQQEGLGADGGCRGLVPLSCRRESWERAPARSAGTPEQTPTEAKIPQPATPPVASGQLISPPTSRPGSQSLGGSGCAGSGPASARVWGKSQLFSGPRFLPERRAGWTTWLAGLPSGSNSRRFPKFVSPLCHGFLERLL